MFETIFGKFWGRLTPDACMHDQIVMGGVVSMIMAGATVIGLLTYYKRWTWIWKEWLTSVDPKKIGAM